VDIGTYSNDGGIALAILEIEVTGGGGGGGGKKPPKTK
jgi:hypothetical protein